MEIKELRAKQKLTQKQFAEKFNIPIKTLQKWEQHESDPLPYLITLIQDEITAEEYIDVSKYYRKQTNIFRAAESYYEKALSNFKTAKIIFYHASEDEEQLNAVGFHIQQSIEFAVLDILCKEEVSFQKTHDLNQLIAIANERNINLHLPEYIVEKADIITLWETKTRYIMGFKIEYQRIKKALEELEKYFKTLSKHYQNYN